MRAQPDLVRARDLPHWLNDNAYIVNWCRRPNLTVSQCIVSMVQLHNQTLNIWTHLAGLFFFQYQLLYAFPEHVTSFTGKCPEAPQNNEYE